MTDWVGGMRITADRLNDNSLTEETSTGLTAGSGFSVVSFSGRRVNGITTVEAFVNRTGSAIAEGATNTGNISDTTLATLPSDWRPGETINAVWGNGSNDGECTIATDGIISLRSTSGNSGIANDTNVRVTAFWISG